MKHALRPLAPLVGALALLAAGPAAARDASQEEVDALGARVASLEARLAQLERMLSGSALGEMSRQLDGLQADLRGLRGAVEEQGFAQRGLRQQSRDLYADLDARLQKLEQAPATATPGAALSDQQAYDAALAELRAGRYAEAERALAEFGKQHPASPLADNAQYWRGEALYVQRDFDAALAVFQAVATREPESRKAPDALLKLALCQYELGREPLARQTLARLKARFPDSDAAREAESRLTRWDAARTP